MKLYYSPGACSLGPHIVLRELGLEAELVPIPVAERANHSPEYLRINPRARVPALEVDGGVITEAPALMVYLASLKGDPKLLPANGSAELARCLEWLTWFNSSFHIAYAQFWRPERFLPEGSDSGAFAAHARTIIISMMGEIEERLEGPWLIGDDYSLADCYALAFYRWGFRIELPVEQIAPWWTLWAHRMLDRPAVRSAIEAEGIGYDQFYPREPVETAHPVGAQASQLR